jgi:5'-3' exonuclease
VGERDFVVANGIRPDQYALFLALRGDSSDNIKGVPGIGRVTARKLLRKYGTLENLLGDQSPGSVALAAGYGRYLRETTSFLKMKDDVDIPGLGVEELHGRYAGMLDRRTNELLALSGYEKCFSRGPDSPGPGTPEVG